MTRRVRRRRFLIPETVSTSEMDCGPAAVASLLGGFGIQVSYGRLREACQTSVDGTSIDQLEEMARQLGLQVEQVMLPSDLLLLPEARALPALAVTQQPDGSNHFVVLWRRVRGLVQVMDPARGRYWVRARTWLPDLYEHIHAMPAAAWRAWAGGPAYERITAARLRALGINRRTARSMFETAAADPEWRGLATLDAAIRLVDRLIEEGGLRAGGEARRAIEAFVTKAGTLEGLAAIPPMYWSVHLVRGEPEAPEPVTEQVHMTGAVLVRALGRASDAEAQPDAPDELTPELSPELAAAIAQPRPRPIRRVWRMLAEDGALRPAVLIVAMATAALGAVVEALLMRGMLDLTGVLGPTAQRVGAVAALAVFLLTFLLIEYPLALSLLRMGRRLEIRLRQAFMEKIPRLGDRYFRSRPTSDMAERGHSIDAIRGVPTIVAQILRAGFGVVCTAAGIIWLDPALAPVVLAGGGLSIVVPLLVLPMTSARDLRFRTHAGALGRFYLDALTGLLPIRTHGAERAIQRAHEGLLVEWMRAGLSLERLDVLVGAVLALGGYGLSAWILFDHLGRADDTRSVLLLAWWALGLPALTHQLVRAIRAYPAVRSLTLRLFEPLDAPAPEQITDEHAAPVLSPGPLAIELDDVSVQAAGREILGDINLRIAPGEHLAIVGLSGAGKSSLLGLLLGWHRPATGRVHVDGRPLDGPTIAAVRARTAWVDPAAQLWNRSLLSNLRYGHSEGALDLSGALEQAELRGVVERLPDGLRSSLGEAGGLVSGGEGQRIRLGRAFLSNAPKLVLLDEPFRGLDRPARHRLLAQARERWADATLLCVTHDLSDTTAFDRVLVVDEGRIAEDDAPGVLAARAGSRYAALVAREQTTARVWRDPSWRSLEMQGGQLREVAPSDSGPEHV